MSSSATSLPVEDSARKQAPMTLARYMTLVGWGLMVTTLGQMVAIGNQPIRKLITTFDGLKLSTVEMSVFISVAILPWSLKPLAGLLSESVPIFGTRRKYYIVFGCLGAGLAWIGMSLVPWGFPSEAWSQFAHRTANSTGLPSLWICFLPLLWVALGLNIAAVIASTVTGGLLVEGGQAHGATGRLSSLRLVIINTCTLVTGPLGGFLAEKWFGWTSLTGGLMFLSMVPVTLLLLREPPLAKQAGQGALSRSWQQLKNVLKSKTLWIAGGLFFLIQVSPGVWSPLYSYQTAEYELGGMMFSQQFIGNLGIANGAAGLIASFVYPFFCRRFRLRTLLYFAIFCTLIGRVAYLGYISHTTAWFIEAASGLGLTLAQLPLFDLAARATPKGSEALAYSLMIAFWNIGLNISDPWGSSLYEKYHGGYEGFVKMIWIGSVTTAIVWLAIPFLPKGLVDQKEGQTST